MKRDKNFEAKRAHDIMAKCAERSFAVVILDKDSHVVVKFCGYWSSARSGDIFHLSAKAYPYTTGLEDDKLKKKAVAAGYNPYKQCFSSVAGGYGYSKVSSAVASVMYDMQDLLEKVFGIKYPTPEECQEKYGTDLSCYMHNNAMDLFTDAGYKVIYVIGNM